MIELQAWQNPPAPAPGAAVHAQDAAGARAPANFAELLGRVDAPRYKPEPKAADAASGKELPHPARADRRTAAEPASSREAERRRNDDNGASTAERAHASSGGSAKANRPRASAPAAAVRKANRAAGPSAENAENQRTSIADDTDAAAAIVQAGHGLIAAAGADSARPVATGEVSAAGTKPAEATVKEQLEPSAEQAAAAISAKASMVATTRDQSLAQEIARAVATRLTGDAAPEPEATDVKTAPETVHTEMRATAPMRPVALSREAVGEVSHQRSAAPHLAVARAGSTDASAAGMAPATPLWSVADGLSSAGGAAPSSVPAVATGVRPQDFASLIDRLTQAREAAGGARSEIALAHPEFGQVSLSIQRDGAELAVTASSADPDFAPAAVAAATVPREPDKRQDDRTPFTATPSATTGRDASGAPSGQAGSHDAEHFRTARGNADAQDDSFSPSPVAPRGGRGILV